VHHTHPDGINVLAGTALATRVQFVVNLVICLGVLGWIFRTGYRLRN